MTLKSDTDPSIWYRIDFRVWQFTEFKKYPDLDIFQNDYFLGSSLESSFDIFVCNDVIYLQKLWD